MHVRHWLSTHVPYTTLFRSQNVIIQDITPPATLTLAEVTGECSASVTAPTTTDNCAGVITGTEPDPTRFNSTHAHVAYSVFCVRQENSTAVTQNVIIQDTTP